MIHRLLTVLETGAPDPRLIQGSTVYFTVCSFRFSGSCFLCLPFNFLNYKMKVENELNNNDDITSNSCCFLNVPHTRNRVRGLRA